jgi:hypothetical protein
MKNEIYLFSIVGCLRIMIINTRKNKSLKSTKNSVTYKRYGVGNRYALMNGKKVSLLKIPKSVKKALRRSNSVTIHSTRKRKRSSSSRNSPNTLKKQFIPTTAFIPQNTRAFTKPTATTKVSTIFQQNNESNSYLASLSSHKNLALFFLSVQELYQYWETCNNILIDLFPPVSNSPKSSQSGGACEKPILSLQYQLSDTWHDFGGTRNSIYPCSFSAYDFLQESRSFLNYIKLPVAQDALSSYYTNYGNFEERIKIDYISGMLQNCDYVLPNTSFYFNYELKTDNRPILSALNNYIEQQKIYKNSNFTEFYDNVISKYKYYLLDACMSIHKEPVFTKNGVIELNSLCNLWDPAGSTYLPKPSTTNTNNDFIDNNSEYNLHLVPENIKINGKEYIVLDSKTIDKELSIYDTVYDPLLNKFCLESYNIEIKLRLYSYESSKYKVCIVLYQNKTPFHIAFLKDGGFDLSELAVGMAYINDPKPVKPGDKNVTYNCDKVTKKLDSNLKEMIDVLYEKMEKRTTVDKRANDLKVLMARLKSTGDHGSAETVKFINQNCGKAVMYLSGDQLCFIYSMMIGNPTLFRYFASKKADSCDKDDKCSDNDCVKNRIHYVGFYDMALSDEQKQQMVLNQKTKIIEFVKNEDGLNLPDIILTPSKSSPGTNAYNSIDNDLGKMITDSYESNKKFDNNILKNISQKLFKLINKGSSKNQMEYLYKLEKSFHEIHYLQNVDKMKKAMKAVSDKIESMNFYTQNAKSARVKVSPIEKAYRDFKALKNENTTFYEYLKLAHQNEQKIDGKKRATDNILGKLLNSKMEMETSYNKALTNMKKNYRQSYGIFEEAAKNIKNKFLSTIRENIKNKEPNVSLVVKKVYNFTDSK